MDPDGHVNKILGSKSRGLSSLKGVELTMCTTVTQAVQTWEKSVDLMPKDVTECLLSKVII